MELRVRKFTTKVPDYDLGGVLGLALVVVLDARPPLREGVEADVGAMLAYLQDKSPLFCKRMREEIEAIERETVNGAFLKVRSLKIEDAYMRGSALYIEVAAYCTPEVKPPVVPPLDVPIEDIEF